MNETLTITSKGQTTLPAVMRQKLGISKQGGQLRVEFDERRGEIRITKQLSMEELSARISGYVKPGTQPILDANAYYQVHRQVRS